MSNTATITLIPPKAIQLEAKRSLSPRNFRWRIEAGLLKSKEVCFLVVVPIVQNPEVSGKVQLQILMVKHDIFITPAS